MKDATDRDTQDTASASLPSESSALPSSRINSRELFRNGREVEIDHEGRIYRLRLTQMNKLILTA